jgi:hypothetical protein
MKPVQIKAEYNQLLEMAAAFGATWFGAALVVNLDYAALIREEGRHIRAHAHRQSPRGKHLCGL